MIPVARLKTPLNSKSKTTINEFKLNTALLNKSDFTSRFGKIDFLESANQLRCPTSTTRKTAIIRFMPATGCKGDCPAVQPAGDSQRDNHIQVIDQYGRIAWQKKTGYGLRNYAELAVQKVKRIFGNTMKARKLPQQKAEAWTSAVALNRMTGLGMPVSVKI